MRRRITGSMRRCGRAWSSSCSNGWCGFAMPFCRSADGLTRCPAAGWWMPSPRLAVPLALVAWRRSQNGLAARRVLDAQGGSGNSRDCGNCAGCWCWNPGRCLSVLVIFLMVLFLASVAEYFLERDVQPATFGSVPAALWWAVVDPDHHGIWRRGADHAARPRWSRRS